MLKTIKEKHSKETAKWQIARKWNISFKTKMDIHIPFFIFSRN